MEFTVDDDAIVGSADATATINDDVYSFGELALLYTCPRAATVVAVTFFRVDQKTFRYLLQVYIYASKCSLYTSQVFYDRGRNTDTPVNVID